MVKINKHKISKLNLTIYKIFRLLLIKLIGFHPTIYFQDFSKVHFEENVWIGPNVCFITSNHKIKNLSEHKPHLTINIGNNSWIGANSIILPNITLGKNTIVGAGSVVTKSFPEGNCIIVGNPAKKIKNL